MKITIFFLLTAISSAFANSSYSQNTRFSLHLENVTIRQVFDEIQKKSEFIIFYKDNQVDLNHQSNIDVVEATVDEILGQILKNTNLGYKIIDRQIVISTDKMKVSPSVIKSGVIAEQKKEITGTVKDNKGFLIPGVSIAVKGTNIGTVTDVEGQFKFSVPMDSKILVFSFVGMKAQEIIIGNSTILNVILTEETFGVDEVVIMGYGVIKKSDLTGSVSSLKSDQIMLGMAQSPDVALRGKLAGVQISSVSGQPGAGAVVRIRGNNSILAPNEPLYVVDGVPLDGGGAAGGIAGVSASPLTIINPSDIESMEILKDASATAIYGSRGANGVVLITTKRGKSGKSIANFNATYGLQNIANPIKLTSPEQWARLWNESMDYINNGNGKFDLNNLPARTDWMGQLFRTAPVQSYDLSFKGGGDKLTYMISGSYTDQEGIVVNTDFKRYSLRSNLENIFNKWLIVGANISATRTVGNQAGQGDMDSDSPVARIALSSPLVPIFNADGSYNLYGDFEGYRPNAYASLYEQTNQDTRNRLISNIYADVTLFKSLKFKSSFATDVSNSKSNYYLPSYIAEGLAYKGLAAIGSQNTLYWNSTNTLSFDKKFDKNHAVTAVLGLEWQKNTTEALYLRGSGFTNDNARFNNISEASSFLGSSGYADWQMLSYISRVNYSFKNRYSFTFTGRIDGSSRFGINNKYAYFPSSAFAWRANEEEFLKQCNILSNLKFRVSYGTSGEQGIPIYQTFSTLAPRQVYVGRNSLMGYFPGRPSNPSLRWEVTGQTNAGVDLGLWGGRVNATLDLYYKKTTDLLYLRPLPPSSGYSSVLQNIGAVENKGIELAFDFVVIDTKRFQWNLNINNSWNRNKLLELGDGRMEIINPEGGVAGGGLKNRPSILRVGEPLGILYGYISDGVIFDQAESIVARDMGMLQYAPGELKIRDISGPNGLPDGKITTDDKTIIGNANPKFTGGMTNTFSYLGLQLTILSSWSYGNEILNYQHLANQLMKSAGNNATKQWYDNHWTIDRPSRSEPRAGYDVRAYPDVSYHVFDGSYFKINNIALSYTLPKQIVASLKLQMLRFTASMDNVYTFTGYPGWSPDLSIYANNVMAQGIDVAAYPLPQTVNFGILIGF